MLHQGALGAVWLIHVSAAMCAHELVLLCLQHILCLSDMAHAKHVNTPQVLLLGIVQILHLPKLNLSLAHTSVLLNLV
jgi:hypothetical protein